MVMQIIQQLCKLYNGSSIDISIFTSYEDVVFIFKWINKSENMSNSETISKSWILQGFGMIAFNRKSI